MKESIFKFALGEEVQDQITKSKGIITARSEWITGCNTYMVQPMAKNEGEKAPDLESYDETRLDKISDGVSLTFKGYYKPDAIVPDPKSGTDTGTKPASKKPGGPAKNVSISTKVHEVSR
jgi:hypothetical protein